MATTPSNQPYSTNPLDCLPGKLPQAQIPDGVDLQAGPNTIADKFPHLAADDFTDDAIWRDTYGLTGTMRTFYSSDRISTTWGILSKSRGVSSAVKIVPNSAKIIRLHDEASWLECRFTFQTKYPETECSAILHLVPAAGGIWKIWVLRTILEQISGHGNVDSLAPCIPQTDSSMHVEQESISSSGKSHFHAVIIGGGQSGLSTGGRLQALGVSYVILEKNEEVGAAWGLRYNSAKLHTVREYAHLLFGRTFGSELGEYLGKEELAAGHKKWAKEYGINISLSTTLESGTWDIDRQLYTLSIKRNGATLRITAKHVVFATGAGSQVPLIPEWPDKHQFAGILMHSQNYKSAVDWKGKRGIVVGTANTAHDVADDMLEAGMAVTMIQRSRTFVLPVEYIASRYHLLYNENIPTEISDRTMFSNPISISRLLSAQAFHPMAKAQPERWEALEQVGFKVNPYGDIQEAINIKLGGHYIDVGTSAKISKGYIKVKSDALVERYTQSGLAFTDGTKIDADVIVLATGFDGNLRNDVERIFGDGILADTQGGLCLRYVPAGLWMRLNHEQKCIDL
ncbi:hypothetical protein TrVFT333_003415 [Trichoderma virens FT-333]|nr:hypothetical protein TrVFT333_003415 [Trichoderma virens FT-333]